MIVHAIFGNIPLPKRTSSHKPPAEVSPPKFYLAPAPLHSFNTIIACWFVGGDDLNKALHVLWLQLSPPPRSSLAPVISRMELFWHRLPQIHLKTAVKPERGDEPTNQRPRSNRVLRVRIHTGKVYFRNSHFRK